MQLNDFLGAPSSRHTPSGKRLYREKQNGFMLEYYQLYLNELETVIVFKHKTVLFFSV